MLAKSGQTHFKSQVFWVRGPPVCMLPRQSRLSIKHNVEKPLSELIFARLPRLGGRGTRAAALRSAEFLALVIECPVQTFAKTIPAFVLLRREKTDKCGVHLERLTLKMPLPGWPNSVR